MAMRITAILNLKGGVAKTTTAINMAAILAGDHDKRVLLVDADSQCNTTEFMATTLRRGSLADLLRNNKIFDEESPFTGYIQPTKVDKVDLICADDSLMDLDLSMVKTGGVGAQHLRFYLKQVQQAYDFVIIDCPPAFNAACAAGLIAADDVIIPIKLDAFSLRGMTNLMRQISNMRKINPKLKLAGVLPTMWYKDLRVARAEAQLEDAGLHVFPHIRATKKVDKMTWEQTPLSVCSPRCAASRDYKKFVAEYIGGADHV